MSVAKVMIVKTSSRDGWMMDGVTAESCGERLVVVGGGGGVVVARFAAPTARLLACVVVVWVGSCGEEWGVLRWIRSDNFE
jgi:hypothetical protein